MRATAIVRQGRWLALCPRVPDCWNAEHFGPDPVTGHVGGLTGSTFRCNVCKVETPSDWPVNVDDITYVLSLRPAPATRNWEPPETIHDLLTDNFRHGIAPDAPTAIDGRPGEMEELFALTGDRFTGGLALPAGAPHLGIGA